MVVNNTVKNEGCARDKIIVCSVQSFVKDEKGELSFAKHNPVVVEHGDDIVIKAGTHNIVKGNAGEIVARTVARPKGNDDLTH